MWRAMSPITYDSRGTFCLPPGCLFSALFGMRQRQVTNGQRNSYFQTKCNSLSISASQKLQAWEGKSKQQWLLKGSCLNVLPCIAAQLCAKNVADRRNCVLTWVQTRHQMHGDASGILLPEEEISEEQGRWNPCLVIRQQLLITTAWSTMLKHERCNSVFFRLNSPNSRKTKGDLLPRSTLIKNVERNQQVPWQRQKTTKTARPPDWLPSRTYLIFYCRIGTVSPLIVLEAYQTAN